MLIHRVKRPAHLARKAHVIAHMMVAWKECDSRIRPEPLGSEHSVEDCRSGTAVARLHDDLRARQVIDERLVELPMLFLDDYEAVVERKSLSDPRQRILEPRNPVQHRTELLRYIVLPGYEPGHGA